MTIGKDITMLVTDSKVHASGAVMTIGKDITMLVTDRKVHTSGTVMTIGNYLQHCW